MSIKCNMHKKGLKYSIFREEWLGIHFEYNLHIINGPIVALQQQHLVARLVAKGQT